MINYTSTDVIVAPDGKWLYYGTSPVPPQVYRVYTSGTNGSVIATPNRGIAGTQVSLTNTPDEGYQFSSYSVTGATISDNKFNIGDSDVYVHGNFELIPPPYKYYLLSLTGYDINRSQYFCINNLKLNGQVPAYGTVYHGYTSYYYRTSPFLDTTSYNQLVATAYNTSFTITYGDAHTDPYLGTIYILLGNGTEANSCTISWWDHIYGTSGSGPSPYNITAKLYGMNSESFVTSQGTLLTTTTHYSPYYTSNIKLNYITYNV